MPGGVLGGITVILYGMIGLLGAQIWVHNKVDLRNPLNLVPVAAGVIIGVGGVSLKVGENFELGGIALGTIVVLLGYHVLRTLAPADLKPQEPLLDAGDQRIRRRPAGLTAGALIPAGRGPAGPAPGAVRVARRTRCRAGRCGRSAAGRVRS
ncbi:hypothetical protein SANTM175S_01178 [Streptomyces antimycoticus]